MDKITEKFFREKMIENILNGGWGNKNIIESLDNNKLLEEYISWKKFRKEVDKPYKRLERIKDKEKKKMIKSIINRDLIYIKKHNFLKWSIEETREIYNISQEKAKDGYIDNKMNELNKILLYEFGIYFDFNLRSYKNLEEEGIKNLKNEFIKIAKEIINFLIDFLFNKQPDKLRVKKPEFVEEKIIKSRKINSYRNTKYRTILFFRRHLTNKLSEDAQKRVEIVAKKIIGMLSERLEKLNIYKIIDNKRY